MWRCTSCGNSGVGGGPQACQRCNAATIQNNPPAGTGSIPKNHSRLYDRLENGVMVGAIVALLSPFIFGALAVIAVLIAVAFGYGH